MITDALVARRILEYSGSKAKRPPLLALARARAPPPGVLGS